jgi:hypothetical protein
MKNRFFAIAAMVGVLVLGAAFVASAAPVGREAPITQDLASYFAGYGVDAQYLGVPTNTIPADQLAKIEAVLNLQDDKTNGLYPYTTLTRLVQEALSAAVDKVNDPVYVELGGKVWEKEFGVDPSTVPSTAVFTASQDAWVPIS